MAEVAQYTVADVATRNGAGDAPLWVIYKDGVYDVTKYIDGHPVGPEPIVAEAGTDITESFEIVEHSSDAMVVLAKYKIGEIVEEEKKYNANGKKKKRVVAVPPEKQNRSCINVITCGLLC